jgi:ABC-type polar amino acid transport system ATPase subunit
MRVSGGQRQRIALARALARLVHVVGTSTEVALSDVL